MQSTFSAAIAKRPLQPFQWLVIAAALIVLVIEGIDLQSLPLVTPLILEEWGIDRALFGPALAAALFGMAFGSSLGGWLGDRWGRLRALYLASVIFGASTIAAAWTNDVWSISIVRALGGLGFGAAYPNALALVNDWFPPASGLTSSPLCRSAFRSVPPRRRRSCLRCCPGTIGAKSSSSSESGRSSSPH
jgi:AAHS family 4-hydroxybenzoate transporter-like MFS transporter